MMKLKSTSAAAAPQTGPVRSGPQPAAATDAIPRWTAKRYLVIGGVVTLSLFLGVGVWSARAMIAGAVIAPAELRVEGKQKTVQHLDGGVVDEIMVRDGDLVQKNAILMRLDDTSVAANLEIVESQLDEMLARRIRLEAESRDAELVLVSPDVLERTSKRPQAKVMLEGQKTLFEARRDTLKQQMTQLSGRIEQTREEIEGGKSQISALERQLKIIRGELKDNRELLRKGLIQRPRVLQLEREEASLDGQRGALLSAGAQLLGRISEIEIRMLELRSSRIEEAITELRNMNAQIAELRERRTALADQLSRMEIRAPETGVVLDMSVDTVGGVVTPAEPLMYIVPTDTALVVEARIEVLARDQVHIDQDATVLFPGFNQRTTPELKGHVAKVGAGALEDERTGFPYFLVEIAISESEFDRLRAAIDTELVPGMPAEAHLQTGERSAASYLLKPLIDNFNRAWRED